MEIVNVGTGNRMGLQQGKLSFYDARSRVYFAQTPSPVIFANLVNSLSYSERFVNAVGVGDDSKKLIEDLGADAGRNSPLRAWSRSSFEAA